MTTVWLARHGEAHNPGGLLYGRLPRVRLTPEGLAAFADSAGNGTLISKETLAPLDARERAVFLRLLAKLV